MARQNAIGVVIQEGNNANGEWLRVGNRLQCWHTMNLVFSSINFLEATWTFPVTFNGSFNIRVFPVLRNQMSGATPTSIQISGLFNQSVPTTTSALIRLSRVSGFTNFASGDAVPVDLYAVGQAP